jgi:hypothetical protein
MAKSACELFEEAMRLDPMRSRRKVPRKSGEPR